MSEYDENAVPEEETAPEIPEDDAAEASEETTAEDNKTKTEEKEQAPENGPEKKTRRIPLFAAVIAALAAAVLASQITFLTVRQSYHKKLATIEQDRFADSKLSQLDQIYRKYYINEIDENALIDGLIEGYILGTGDKYGNYMSRSEYDEYVEGLNSRTDGIGVSVIWNTEYLAVEVLSVYDDSPAQKAGIEPGDLIVGVDGKNVAELGFDDTINAVRGEKGSKVTLTLRRGEGYAESLTVEPVRDTVTASTVKSTQYGNIAVIAISSFHENTPDELKEAVSTAQAAGCDRIVFDMRNNPGGLLSSVRSMLDYILPEGDVVRMVDAEGNWTSLSSDASCVSMPMVVIVNGNTASAAELFTSALMDYDYATVIGTQTYGKGTVTAPYALSDGSVVYISMQHYYPPKSDNFEGKGITPDEVVELSEESKKINFYKLTYETDDQLRRAIEIIKEK
ncbi:MAG: PDZ domain-containing protein [Clostridia bacterium]|nr:PDZ domain-containing protein [Clostridia bacterium]